MKIYLPNGDSVDDGRIPRNSHDYDGWYSGKAIEDRRGPEFPWWLSIVAVIVLCLAIILLCTEFAPEKPHCDLQCRDLKGMSTTLTPPSK